MTGSFATSKNNRCFLHYIATGSRKACAAQQYENKAQYIKEDDLEVPLSIMYQCVFLFILSVKTFG